MSPLLDSPFFPAPERQSVVELNRDVDPPVEVGNGGFGHFLGAFW
jgi:hypothetical protein